MKTTLILLLKFLNKRELLQGVILVIGSIVGSLFEIVALGAIIPMVAVLGHAEPTSVHPVVEIIHDWLGNPDRITFAIFGLIGIIILFVVKTSFLSMLFFCNTRYVWGIRERICRDLITLYIHASHEFHLSRNPIRMANHLTGDVSIVTRCLGISILMVGDLIFLLGVLAILLRIDPLTAGMGIVPVLIGAGLFHKIVNGRNRTWGEIAQREEHSRREYARYAIEGLKELRIAGKEAFFSKRFIKSSHRTARAQANSTLMELLSRPWLETIAVLGLLLLTLGFINSERSFDSLLPMLILAAAAGMRSLPAITRLLTGIQRLRRGTPYLEAVAREFKDADKATTYGTTKIDQSIEARTFRELNLRGISFRYPSRPDFQVLESIDLTLQSGDTVGIAGESGAGKSTLIDILLGLLKPDKGIVLFNGVDLEDHLTEWRRIIGYLPQNVFLFDSTIAANIAIGQPPGSIDTNQLKSAVRDAGLDDFISNLPMGIDTEIGESGTRISGGQRQRLGIARMLYQNSKVMILDEPTASLDNATAGAFWQALLNNKGDKTLIVISHDIQIIESCDISYTITSGKLEETFR